VVSAANEEDMDVRIHAQIRVTLALALRVQPWDQQDLAAADELRIEVAVELRLKEMR